LPNKLKRAIHALQIFYLYFLDLFIFLNLILSYFTRWTSFWRIAGITKCQLKSNSAGGVGAFPFQEKGKWRISTTPTCCPPHSPPTDMLNGGALSE